MDITEFMSVIDELGGDFFTGVPDSLLAPFCDYLMETYGVGAGLSGTGAGLSGSSKHIVAANEGAAVGLAAGHYLGTGKPSVVYMQNSGIGNAVNPICSLTKLYDVPVIYVIGWRGEPGVPDEPQHSFQGEVTLSLLDCLQIPYVVIEEGSTVSAESVSTFKNMLKSGQSVAFVVKKNALKNDKKTNYPSHISATMSREEILSIILENAGPNDVFVCTTGKLAREVFEIRERLKAGHNRDFLTVGSMGHSLMIAYGIAISGPEKVDSPKVYCLDGDGAAIMHMGSLAVVGAHKPGNLVHVVVNNGAHETVGGMPVVSCQLDLSKVALSLGYRHSFRTTTEGEVKEAATASMSLNGPIFIEAICNLESRKDLGRPTTTPLENKVALMDFLS